MVGQAVLLLAEAQVGDGETTDGIEIVRVAHLQISHAIDKTLYKLVMYAIVNDKAIRNHANLTLV